MLHGAWHEKSLTFHGQYYSVDELIVEPKPIASRGRPHPVLYAGGQSDKAKSLISGACEAYVMHGDPADRIAPKVADMRARRDASGGSAMQFGMAAYIIVRDSEAEAVGTPEYVADRIREFEATGVDLLLLQCSPHLEEMERVAEQVMPLVRARALHLHEVAA